ncbi:hypothetical protein DY000_02031645 [Brassica cretica]|uniref:Uncharacterized protein n=1 Tax=Brassica cretica TaxID=69181 RepID=A0ABQ7DNJ1_BRACR|nr:hypothetical protein DY000_02031645 [Brassica cretica]
MPKVKVQSWDDARSYSYNINTSRSIKYAKRSKETGPETLLKVQYILYELERNTQGPEESSMRILSFGLRVSQNLLIPLVLSLARILPL